MGQIDQ